MDLEFSDLENSFELNLMKMLKAMALIQNMKEVMVYKVMKPIRIHKVELLGSRSVKFLLKKLLAKQM